MASVSLVRAGSDLDTLVLSNGLLLALLLAGLLYWQLELAEGAYLGRRVVVWLYDRFAPRYDKTKRFDERDEAWFLGEPLTKSLRSIPNPLVLDVATGTGRLPLALFRQPDFDGRVVGLDLSRQMLRHAVANNRAYGDRLTLLWQGASRLPFPDDVFDAVVCLEALEFLPDSYATLAEMVRVLRPGSVLLVSNRTGPGVRWMPGRTMSREDFVVLLEALGLTGVRAGPWQVDYDIAWGRKPGRSFAPSPSTLPALLCCPHCRKGHLFRQDRAFVCQACERHYPLAEDDVVEMGY